MAYRLSTKLTILTLLSLAACNPSQQKDARRYGEERPCDTLPESCEETQDTSAKSCNCK